MTHKYSGSMPWMIRPDWPAQQQDIQAAYFHANSRLRERYGIDLLIEEYALLCREIYESGPINSRTTPRLLSYAENGRQVIRMRMREHSLTALWCPKTGLILTFLPLEGRARPTDVVYKSRRKTVNRKGRWR